MMDDQQVILDRLDDQLRITDPQLYRQFTPTRRFPPVWLAIVLVLAGLIGVVVGSFAQSDEVLLASFAALAAGGQVLVLTS